MKKTVRSIVAFSAFMTLLIICTSIFCGCNILNNSANFDRVRLVKEFEAFMDKNSEKSVLTAHPYLQAVALSWEYSVQIEVKDGEIYLNEVLYDKVTHTDELEIKYGEEVTLQLTSKEPSVSETLEAIKQHKGCYVLETDSSSKFGKKVAVFLIDDEFYFVNFFDGGNVMRIHSTIVK